MKVHNNKQRNIYMFDTDTDLQLSKKKKNNFIQTSQSGERGGGVCDSDTVYTLDQGECQENPYTTSKEFEEKQG